MKTNPPLIRIFAVASLLMATVALKAEAPADSTPPTVTISPPSSSSTTTGPVTYAVSYADANFSSSTLTSADVLLNITGTAGGTVSVSGLGTSFTVTISNISGTGTLGISIPPGTATDLAGNAAPGAVSQTFMVGNSPNSPPIISNIPGQTMVQGTVLSINFTVTDLETPAADLQVTAQSSNQSLVPTANIILSGSGATRIATITPTPNQIGTSLITLMVTDEGGMASVASFSLTVNAAPSVPPQLALGNLVWHDLNGNGTHDLGEPGIGGVALYLHKDNGDGVLGFDDAFQGSAFTDFAGNYQFNGLAAGAYFVRVDPFAFQFGLPLAGMASSTGAGPADNDIDGDDNGVDSPFPAQQGGIVSTLITLAAGTEPEGDGDGPDGNQTVDFGFVQVPPLSLGNLVWHDVNANGIHDPGEPGIGGVSLYLYKDNGNGVFGFEDAFQGSAFTDFAGNYQFNWLIPGAYFVRVDPFAFAFGRPLSGMISSLGVNPSDNDIDGDDNGVDSAFPAQEGIASTLITLAAGTEPAGDGDGSHGNQTVDFGFVPSGVSQLSLGNQVWHDLNGNGTHDPGEPGIGGVSLSLLKDNGDGVFGFGDAFQGSAFTDFAGNYRFMGLIPGAYFVLVDSFVFNFGLPLTGMVSSPGASPADNDIDGDDNGVDNPIPGQLGIISTLITLGVGTEPAGDGDGADGNQTLDFGFVQTPAAGLAISHIQDQGGSEDSPVGPLNFTVIGVTGPVESLIITASSSDASLFPPANIIIAGTGLINRTITLTPAPNQVGAASIVLTVADGMNNASTVFHVFVNPVNDPPTIQPLSSMVLGPNAPMQTVSLFGIGSGAENEFQTLTVTAVSSNPALIPNPSVHYTSPNSTGEISFTPLANASGTCAITVIVTESGGLSATTSFTVTVTPNPISQVFEGDVRPRPDGNGLVSITDWVQLGRFVARLDAVLDGSEFQRADCAPRQDAQGNQILGNGILSAIDWVQAGRYAAGLDPITPSGGPTSAAETETNGPDEETARLVRIASASTIVNSTFTLPVEMVSLGDENALSFSLNFDSANLSFINVNLDPLVSDAILMANLDHVGNGKIGIALAKTPGQSFTAGTVTLLHVTFTVGSTVGQTSMTFDSSLVQREVSDASATPLPANYLAGSITINPAVFNALPIVRSAQTAITVDEGGVANNHGTWSDADGDDVVLNASLGTIIKGTGTWSWQFETPDGPAGAHVVITADDGHGGIASTGFDLAVNNVAPKPSIFIPESGLVQSINIPISFSGSIADPGILDTHTGSWTFNTAGASPDTVDASISGNTVGDQFQFSAPGVYFFTLQASDKDGASGTTSTVNGGPAHVIIVDPDGGHVTGGGWIYSSPGALVFNQAAEGKATFGFNAKYSGNNPSILKGNLEFDFQKGAFKFKSTFLEWLVVQNSRAQFKGSGTIKGAGGFSFILTLVDGQHQQTVDGFDRFRLQISDKATGAVIYDNQPGASINSPLDETPVLEGGNVVIHK